MQTRPYIKPWVVTKPCTRDLPDSNSWWLTACLPALADPNTDGVVLVEANNTMLVSYSLPACFSWPKHRWYCVHREKTTVLLGTHLLLHCWPYTKSHVANMVFCPVAIVWAALRAVYPACATHHWHSMSCWDDSVSAGHLWTTFQLIFVASHLPAPLSW